MNFVRLLTAFILSVLTAAPSVSAQGISRPDAIETLGKKVPLSWFVDDNGDTLTVADLAGTPTIVSPVFTTCPHICPAITASLVSALDGLGGVGKTFKVLTLSFDPGDDKAALRKYRENTGMPSEWLLASGVPEQIDPFLEAIDFRYEAVPSGGFAHANAVVFLTGDLTISGYLYGMMYTADEVKAALRVAADQPSLVERARPFLLLAAALALAVTAFVIIVTTRRAHRRSGVSAHIS